LLLPTQPDAIAELRGSGLWIRRKHVTSPGSLHFNNLARRNTVTDKKLDQQIDKKGTRPEQKIGQPKTSTANQKDSLDETTLGNVSGGMKRA
jgi:hypothetical protein